MADLYLDADENALSQELYDHALSIAENSQLTSAEECRDVQAHEIGHLLAAVELHADATPQARSRPGAASFPVLGVQRTRLARARNDEMIQLGVRQEAGKE
jgi:hypothetical protein